MVLIVRSNSDKKKKKKKKTQWGVFGIRASLREQNDIF